MTERERKPDLYNFSRSDRMRGLCALDGALFHIQAQFDAVTTRDRRYNLSSGHHNARGRNLLDCRTILLTAFVQVAEDIWTDTPRASEIARDTVRTMRAYRAQGSV